MTLLTQGDDIDQRKQIKRFDVIPCEQIKNVLKTYETVDYSVGVCPISTFRPPIDIEAGKY